MIRTIRTLACAAALLVPAQSVAQAPAQRPMTVRETLLMPSYGSYALSPDGKRVLFTRSDRNEEKEWAAVSHIWLHDLASGRSVQLTNSERGESNPRWLPDGRVLFTSN